jgi:hypothetical protein
MTDQATPTGGETSGNLTPQRAGAALFAVGLVLMVVKWLHVRGVECDWSSGIRSLDSQHAWVEGSAPYYGELLLGATTALALGLSLAIRGALGCALFVPLWLVCALAAFVIEPHPCAEENSPFTAAPTSQASPASKPSTNAYDSGAAVSGELASTGAMSRHLE